MSDVIMPTSRRRPEIVCFCCSNLTGCIVIACLFGTAKIIYAIALYLLLQEKLRYESVTRIFIATVCANGLSLVADILLLIGSIKNIKGVFDPWMLSALIWILLSVIGFFLSWSGTFPFHIIIIGTIVGLAPTIWEMVIVSEGLKVIHLENSNNMEQTDRHTT